MVLCVMNTNSGRGKMQIAGKATKPESHYKKKKLWAGLMLGKREGRSGGIPDFQTSLNTFQPWSQELRVGAVVFHCTGVVPMDASSPSENTFKNALFAEFSASIGLCGSESDFLQYSPLLIHSLPC